MSDREYAPGNYTPTAKTWDIKGYYGQYVSTQANTLEIPNLDGAFDVIDVSDPRQPRRVTGQLACIGMRYALYYIANYGLHGHIYRIESRTNIALRPWIISL